MTSSLSDEFPLSPDSREELFIGAATLQKWRIKLVFEHDQVIVDPKAGKAAVDLRHQLRLYLKYFIIIPCNIVV